MAVDDFVTNLISFRGFEGPQLVLNWNNPANAGITKVQIRRTDYDWPRDIGDGDLVIEILNTTPGEFKYYSDLNVTGQKTYYYTIFSYNGSTWLYDPVGETSEVAFDNRDYTVLWERLPSIYRVKDAETNQLPLTKTQDTTDGQWYNLFESSLNVYGQLYRFLKPFGLTLRYFEEMFKYFQNFYEPLTVDPDLVPLLANMVSMKLFTAVPLQKQRFYLDNILALYKRRGTLEGIRPFLDGNFETTPIIKEYSKNMLESNWEDRTSVDSDDTVLLDYGTPYDTIDYVVDGSPGALYSYRTLGFFFDNALASSITQDMLDRAEEYLEQFLPGSSSWYAFAHWDSAWSDDFNGPSFPGWLVTDVPGWLSQSGSDLIFNSPAGSGSSNIAFMSYPATPPWGAIGTEFAFDIGFREMAWPSNSLTGGYDVFVRLQVQLAIDKNVRFYLRQVWDTILAKEVYYLEGEYRTGTTGPYISLGSVMIDEPSEATLRIERGLDGLIRFIGKVNGGDNIVVAKYHDSAYNTATINSIFLVWTRVNSGSITGTFGMKSDRIDEWETSVGWRQVHP